MADETDQEAEARRQLEEYQRQQAAAAIEASRNQPNAIPNEPVTAAARVAPAGNDILLGPAGGPSTAAMNRPAAEWGTPAGGGFGAYQQRGLNTASEASPAAVAIQGSPLSAEDAAFWAANPNGAVKDPQTGLLIGLGAHNLPRPEAQGAVDYYSKLGSATLDPWGRNPQRDAYYAQRRVYPGSTFPNSSQPARIVTPADLYNPQIKAQMDFLDRDIAQRMERLKTANRQRIGKGPSEHEILSDELKHAQYSRDVLGREFQDNLSNSFAVIRENQKQQDQINHVNAGTEIAQWMAGLPRDPIARSRAWEQELAKPERSNWIEAINGHPEVNDFVRNALTGHQTVAEQQAAIQAAAGGRPVTLEGGSEKNPRFKVSPTLDEAIATQSQKDVTKSLSDAGVTPEQFAQRTKVEQGNLAKDASGKETFTNDNEGTHMRVTIGDHTFAVPVGRYNQLNTAIPATQAQPSAQQTPAAQPTGTRVVGGKTYAWNPQNKRWEPQ